MDLYRKYVLYNYEICSKSRSHKTEQIPFKVNLEFLRFMIIKDNNDF